MDRIAHDYRLVAEGRPLHEQFREDVLSGLAQSQKSVPARWFYDTRGSEFFEQITRLPEYYPTRIETAILRESCPAIAELVGSCRSVVEFGAGSATKTPLVLDALEPECYLPIDISGPFLRESCRSLQTAYPDVRIIPVEADFTYEVELPPSIPSDGRLGFFPGSTIGNFEPYEAVDLLRQMRETLGEGSLILIGMDRIKDPAVLHAAYNDAQGVTAQFNCNLVHRINRELDGDIPLEYLRHVAFWNDAKARIEMHLEATEPCDFSVDGHCFAMRAGETIHTENSHKYDERSSDILLRAGGWEPMRRFEDEEKQFMVILARAMDDADMVP